MIFRTYEGRYKVLFPEKYTGNPTAVNYRSLWEKKMMKYCDLNPHVLKWGYETIRIPYVSPLDKRYHRYLVDFYLKLRNKQGQIEHLLIEVKPKKQTHPPEKKKYKTKQYIQDLYEYGVNEAKWKAARVYAQKRGWEFRIFTEDHLN